MSIINITIKAAILFLGLIVALEFLLILFLIWKVYRVEGKYEKYVIKTANNDGKPIDYKSIGKAIQYSESAKRFIKDLVREELSSILRNPDKGLIEKISDAVYEDIRHLLELNKKEEAAAAQKKVEQSQKSEPQQNEPKKNEPQTSESEKSEPEKEQTSSAPAANARTFYASALLEEDDKTFYNVSEQPVPDETIFKFTEIKSGKCEFVVYEGAYSKVLIDASFLTGACRVAKLGNSKVIVTEKGIAELTDDNKWVVVEPAKVKFE